MNDGKNVIVGTAKTVEYPIVITIKDDSGVRKITDRADWEDLKYHGFTGQEVKLQYRPAGAAHHSTAGSWRWYFPGTTTTARIVSAGDAVTLK
ncbi:hypothetical protein [Streptomyces sp. S3(2020)]|uniref:hypothetical protein n=1 Tax=Streptomyces sp. S3(2020) TaxID=2732044 RepID=UPI003217D666